VARILASHEGDLSLGGLEKFPEEGFDIFSGRNGSVSLPMLTDIERVAAEVNDDDREFIVRVNFDWKGEVSYSGFSIMSRPEIRSLIRALGTDARILMPNVPDYYEEEMPVGELKSAFSICSPWPGDIAAMRRIFGERVGDTSLFTRVEEIEPSSGDDEKED
jgi:hypothetical protein